MGQVLIRSDVIKQEARTHSLYQRYEQRVLGDNRIFNLNDPTVQQNCYQQGPAAAKPSPRLLRLEVGHSRLPADDDEFHGCYFGGSKIVFQAAKMKPRKSFGK